MKTKRKLSDALGDTGSGPYKIMCAGVELAAAEGVGMVSARAVAEKAGVGRRTVTYHFPTVADLREAIQQFADDRSIRLPSNNKQLRKEGSQRRADLLRIAVVKAKAYGVDAITRKMVCDDLNLSEGLINQQFGNLVGLKDAVRLHCQQNGISVD